MGGVADKDDAACCPGGRHDLLDRREVRLCGLIEQTGHRLSEVGERVAPVLASQRWPGRWC